ncbi:MAG: hypothetical protein A2V66_05980 [Ignavibacteria bacterium RBG_13_36_8]|nr:MAG: hypothetical protein A2V66_05980 [Ignavibacteria bacterium RBG_13_36_8]
MKPIWYFVGLILFIMGGIVLLTGTYQFFSPPETKTVLGEIHPRIWWGAIMIIFGGIMFLKNKNVSVD